MRRFIPDFSTGFQQILPVFQAGFAVFSFLVLWVRITHFSGGMC